MKNALQLVRHSESYKEILLGIFRHNKIRSITCLNYNVLHHIQFAVYNNKYTRCSQWCGGCSVQCEVFNFIVF